MMDGPVDPLQVYHARVRVVRAIADALSRDLLCTYEQTKASEKSYVWTPTAAGNRSLSARCLKYLIAQTNPTEREHALRLAEEQFNSANNMTDSFSALAAMNNVPSDERDRCMRAFLDRWGSDNNVVVKYFSLESATDVEGSAARLRAIVDSAVRVGGEDPLGVGSGGDEMSVEGVAQYFDVTIPNHVYALCRTFPASYVNFHAEDGSGYRLLADWILQVDALNAQVGSRLAGPFTKWLSYDKGRRAIIRGELERILEVESLSPNTREIVAIAASPLIGGDSRAQSPSRTVLCLHGFRTNAHVLRLQTQDLFNHVGGDIVPVYIDAPHPARGPAYPAVEMAFPSAKEYGGWKEWYNYQPRDGGGRECYEGMAESIEFVEREVARLQPFAICGFSQGAVIAALVAKNAEERCAFNSASSDVLVHSGNHKPPSVFERGETFERIKMFLNQ
eukprot:g1269.t1